MRSLHLHDAHFPDATTFDARRFLDPKVGRGSTYAPFGGGVSLCEGRVFAASVLPSPLAVRRRLT